MIAIYIEKEFLDNFNLNWNKLKYGEEIYNLLTSFADVDIYHNYDTNDDFIDIEINHIGSIIAAKGHVKIIKSVFSFDSIYQKIDKPIKILFTSNRFNSPNINNFLCFNKDNIDEKWHEISKKLNWKVALDDNTERIEIDDYWHLLKDFEINELILMDKYILSNNFIDWFIGNYIKKFNINKLDFTLLAQLESITNNPYNSGKEISQALKNKLNLSNFKFLEITTGTKISYYFHDRILISNFFLIEIGAGFSRLKNNYDINTVLHCNSIFDEFTYKRIRRLKEKIEGC